MRRQREVLMAPFTIKRIRSPVVHSPQRTKRWAHVEEGSQAARVTNEIPENFVSCRLLSENVVWSFPRSSVGTGVWDQFISMDVDWTRHTCPDPRCPPRCPPCTLPAALMLPPHCPPRSLPAVLRAPSPLSSMLPPCCPLCSLPRFPHRELLRARRQIHALSGWLPSLSAPWAHPVCAGGPSLTPWETIPPPSPTPLCTCILFIMCL